MFDRTINNTGNKHSCMCKTDIICFQYCLGGCVMCGILTF